jgi:hypothetical protein
MIIDAHVHLSEDGKWFNSLYDSSLTKLLDSLEESDIDKAIVLPIAPFIKNDFVKSVTERYSEKLIGFCSIDPKDSKGLAELKRCCRSGDFFGVKLHPRIQQTAILDSTIGSIIEMAASYDLPVIIDAWVYPHDTQGIQVIDSFIFLSSEHPEAKIILPHLGGFMYKSMPRVASETKNIWFDISYIFSRFNMDLLQREICPVLEKIGYDRLIYGSDFPEVGIKQYKQIANELFEFLNWPDAWKHDVFYRNIMRLIYM